MKLASLKTDDSGMCEPCPPNPYGYGTCISLNDDQCEALGITTPIPAGTVVSIQAVAVVESVTESVERDGDDTGNDVSMRLQLTDMGISPMKSTIDPAEMLYSK